MKNEQRFNPDLRLAVGAGEEADSCNRHQLSGARPMVTINPRQVTASFMALGTLVIGGLATAAALTPPRETKTATELSETSAPTESATTTPTQSATEEAEVSDKASSTPTKRTHSARNTTKNPAKTTTTVESSPPASDHEDEHENEPGEDDHHEEHDETDD
jgi:hypothetical protein